MSIRLGVDSCRLDKGRHVSKDEPAENVLKFSRELLISKGKQVSAV
jgi:hypothetical protein